MRQGMVGVVLAAIATVGGGDSERAGRATRDSAGARRDTGADRRRLERSATFRDLRARLEPRTSSFTSGSAVPGSAGCMVWGSADAAPAASDQLDRFGRSPDELTAILAHELQHANEVATDSGITDLDSFQKSFAARGWKHGAGFETSEATRITRQVAAELRDAFGRTQRGGRGTEWKPTSLATPTLALPTAGARIASAPAWAPPRRGRTGCAPRTDRPRGRTARPCP